jgi:hypothetical protein
MATDGVKYPQSHKLEVVESEVAILSEFLQWAQRNDMVTSPYNDDYVVLSYFGINKFELEKERKAMLAEIRAV